MAGLTIASQSDFSAGMFRNGTASRIPANGAYALENCMIDEAFRPARRGGSTYLTTAAFGSRLTWIWDGILGGASKTVVASPTAFGVLNPTTNTITSLGGSGLSVPVRATEFGGKLFLPGGTTYDGTSLGTAAKIADVYTAGGGRLVGAIGNRAYFSAINDATSWAATDYHQLPDGVKIIGAEGTRNQVALFTTAGVWLISGIALDLTDATGDPQQSLDLFSRDLVLWGPAGVAGWRGGLVVPATDGVWLINVGQDAANAPAPFQRISDPVMDLYTRYVQVGCQPGGAVVANGHYFLPILNGPDPVDMLVCRLDRGAWSYFTGDAAQLAALTVRVGSATRQPLMLGAQADSSARITQLSYFDPTVTTDADGTVGPWQVTTRGIPTGPQQAPGLVKKIRAEYLLEAATGTTPDLDAAYAVGEPIQVTATAWGSGLWGSSTWNDQVETYTSLSGTAPEDVSSISPYTWRLAVRAEQMRLRLTCTEATKRAVLSSVQMMVRPRGRQ